MSGLWGCGRVPAWREVGAAFGGCAENEQRTNNGKPFMPSLENALAMWPMACCVPNGAGGALGVSLPSRTVRAAPRRVICRVVLVRGGDR